MQRTEFSLGLIANTLFAFTLAVGCDNDPTAGSTQAAVRDPAPVAEAAPRSANTVTYAFSNAGSKVEFTGAKVTGKHEGAFGTFTGTINVVDNVLERSSVSVEIDAASLAVDQEKLTNHLKSPDFFDVAQFPKVRFNSTSIAADGVNGATHTVTGNLELHGITRSISFPATLRLNAAGAEADASFGINRKDWNIVYPGMPDDLIKDEVLIKLTIRAHRS